MNNEIRNKLIADAKKYGYDNYKLFESEIGWQDWMNEFTNAADGEEASESEITEINNELMEIFFEAHEEEICNHYNESTDAAHEICRIFKSHKGNI